MIWRHCLVLVLCLSADHKLIEKSISLWCWSIFSALEVLPLDWSLCGTRRWPVEGEKLQCMQNGIKLDLGPSQIINTKLNALLIFLWKVDRLSWVYEHFFIYANPSCYVCYVCYVSNTKSCSGKEAAGLAHWMDLCFVPSA